MIQGIKQEQSFWRKFVKTERFINGWAAKIKTPELNPVVADFILKNIPAGSRLLDSGSGAVSILNGLGDYGLTATDLLGDYYATIFDYAKYSLTPPLPIGAENILYHEEFDLVHISNALDHCQQPDNAFLALYNCVKKGGYLIIQGFENEALYENWQGMHQWNLTVENEELVIKGKAGAILTAKANTLTERITLENGKTWLIWITQK